MREIWQRRFSTSATALWLLWMLSRATRRLIEYFPQPGEPLNSDAMWAYLPSAAKLLAAPWQFLLSDPNSYHVAPLGYVWPAMWGADPVRIQLANSALFLLAIVLMWHLARRLGGWVAAATATYLLVSHPTLAFYIPQVLTESLYLFGFLLFLYGCVSYGLDSKRQTRWLVCMGAGLCITLLTRPVLQLMAVAVLLGLLAIQAGGRQRGTEARLALATRTKPVLLALIAALAIPAAVVVKNGLCFQVWGLSSGAGTGLYYGVSPFKLGLEPVFTGFSYDAREIPRTVMPESDGNPLMRDSDEVNKRVAISIVRNTSLADNAYFLAFKLKSWLLYSPPEVRNEPSLRPFRLREWAAISVALLAALARRGLGMPARLSRPRKTMIVLVAALGAVTCAQLVPLLYNDRYNIYFLEPSLILLAGIAISTLIPQLKQPHTLETLITDAAIAVVSLTLVLSIPKPLVKYAQRHEYWGLDANRLGPTSTLLPAHAMSSPAASGARQSSDGFVTDSEMTTLHIPLAMPAQGLPGQYTDAVWRVRLAIQPPRRTPACRKVHLQVTQAATQATDRRLDDLLVHLDGKMHSYAYSGNGRLRPNGPGALELTLNCPARTVIRWGSAELLAITMPQAARALIENGTPINPYLRDGTVTRD